MPKKKIKEIFIGSNNKGKLKEIADLLPKSLKIYSNLDFKIPSPRETGTSFEQNSLLKAKYFSKKTNKICMSDDSGIEIDILNKAPGVYSADWSGRKRNFNLAIKKVYREISKKDDVSLRHSVEDKPLFSFLFDENIVKRDEIGLIIDRFVID